MRRLPAWVDLGLIPLLNLTAALIVTGLVVLTIGEDPIQALRLLVQGSFGFGEARGYTLFYATNFIFTGLAVAVAFHGGLFNIGVEGQAGLGGLGGALAVLYLPLPTFLMVPAAILASMLAGAAWGAVPGWLQARRGSHVVITTILLNFVAASLLTWLLVNILIRPGQQAPETAPFPEAAWLPQLWSLMQPFGIDLGRSPVNLSLALALVMAGLFWVLLWRTRAGYALRVMGGNEAAARYAGIDVAKATILVMALSGGLAGLVAVNELFGAQHRLLLGFTGGAGFVGIAVALMGRNHPVGIVLAALLFGALYQGGAELAFELPRVSRDLVVVVQGLVILFTGGLEHLFRPSLERLFAPATPARTTLAGAAAG